MKNKNIKSNFIQSVVGVFDGLNLGFIYTSFLVPVLNAFMQEIGKYIFFPACILIAVVQSIATCYQCYVNGLQVRSVVTEAVKAFCTLALAVAIIGALAAFSIFGAITPLIFAGTSIAQTCFHAGCSVYYLFKSIFEKNPREKSTLQATAKEEAIMTLVGTIATAAVCGVIVAGKIVLAPLGIFVGVYVVVVSIMHGINTYRSNNEKGELSRKNSQVDLLLAFKRERKNKLRFSDELIVKRALQEDRSPDEMPFISSGVKIPGEAQPYVKVAALSIDRPSPRPSPTSGRGRSFGT